MVHTVRPVNFHVNIQTKKSKHGSTRLEIGRVQQRIREGCIICGRATTDGEMISITIADLVDLKAAMKDLLDVHLKHIDPSIFQYGGALRPVSGLPIDRNGILTADKMVTGSPAIGRGCRTCYSAMCKGKVPDMALGNGLWTGIEVETPLTDLTWIEEKLRLCGVLERMDLLFPHPPTSRVYYV
jgi:hypothetical protein